MAYREIRGNIFSSDSDALVNTINCKGVMGKGIALEFRRRFPDMFVEYQRSCREGLIRPGQIWPYERSCPIVLNFAIKDHWRFPSRVDWIEQCLISFANLRKELELKSVSFPWMGAMNGGIPIETIKDLMRRHLASLPDVRIDVYEFNPDASDPLFDQLRDRVETMSPAEFKDAAKMDKKTVSRIYAKMKADPMSLCRLVEIAGLGPRTTDKLYAFLTRPSSAVRSPDMFGSL